MNHRSRLVGMLAVSVAVAAATGCSGGAGRAVGPPTTRSQASSSGTPRPTPSASPGADPYRAARSVPVTDSYYPQHGVNYLDTLHYGLYLDWQPSTRRLTGMATIRFRVTAARSSVRLDLGAGLRVSTVTIDGKAATSSRSGDYLTIETPALAAESEHTAVVAYAGTPATTPEPATRPDAQQAGFTITPNGEAYTYQEPYGAFTWFPVNDQPADKAYYDATLVAHDGQQGVFNGQVVNDTRGAAGRTTSFHLDAPAAAYLTTVAFGDYRHETATGPHGLPLNYWYAPSGAAAMPTVRKTPQILAWAEGQLGAYPFASAGVVLVPGDSGMETQTMVTMAEDPGAVGGADAYEADYAHELLHSWFGDVVSPRDWSDLWLNESLTFFMQVRYQEERGLPQWWGGYTGLQAVDQRIRDAQGPPGAYRKSDFADSNVYLSGALMLHNLETAYGRTKFDAMLKGWAGSHRFGNADRADFISHVRRTLGAPAATYVSAWLTSPTTPAALAPQS